jgi:NAD-dependent SIR2 family protein deacetylase
MQEIKVEEFVRRIKKLIDENSDCRLAFFLGAGCSVTSGIPGASRLVERWLPKLKNHKTGNIDNLDEWAEMEFIKYNKDNKALIYGEVIEKLFATSEERQREIERLIDDKDPGFGYSVLAQLVTHENEGNKCNVLLTTNFDDLVADALYLFTRKKPLVITFTT